MRHFLHRPCHQPFGTDSQTSSSLPPFQQRMAAAATTTTTIKINFGRSRHLHDSKWCFRWMVSTSFFKPIDSPLLFLWVEPKLCLPMDWLKAKTTGAADYVFVVLSRLGCTVVCIKEWPTNGSSIPSCRSFAFIPNSSKHSWPSSFLDPMSVYPSHIPSRVWSLELALSRED